MFAPALPCSVCANSLPLNFTGYRFLAHRVKGPVHLYTRQGLNWTARFAPIAQDVERVKANHAILDGEGVSPSMGGPSFSALQGDLSTGRTDRMTYYVFDL